jgi:hypothetical protein
MGDLGTFTQSFVATIQGVSFAKTIEFEMPDICLKGNVSSDDGRVMLEVEIGNTDEVSGSTLAIRVAEEFWSLLVAEFAYHIKFSSEIKPGSSTFALSSSSDPTTLRVNVADELSIKVGSDVTLFCPSCSEITALAKQIDWKLKVPEMPISADLYIARTMFRVGLQFGDKVACFLTLYSATSLASLFKSGKCSQNAVDDLLKLANPGLPSSPRPSGPRKGEPESLYTKLRNDFVHAEERGKDPVVARIAIETNSAAFQQDVAILLWKRL